MQGLSLALIALQEFRIVVRFAVYTLPREQRVVARNHAPQGVASELIGDGCAIAFRMAAEPRLGHGDHDGVGHRFILLITDRALNRGTVGARQQIECSDATANAESGFRHIPPSRYY